MAILFFVIGIPGLIDDVKAWVALLAGMLPILAIIRWNYAAIAIGLILVALSAIRLHREERRLRKPTYVINPRFDSDLSAIDEKWLLEPIANEETVLIVVGDTIMAELLDRTPAARLRDQIEEIGRGHPKRRGILVANAVLSDKRVAKNQTVIEKCPKIFVGGPATNDSTKNLIEQAEAATKPQRQFGAGFSIRLDSTRVPRVAVWGKSAKDTDSAVKSFISDPNGLSDFLKACWSDGTAAPSSPLALT